MQRLAAFLFCNEKWLIAQSHYTGVYTTPILVNFNGPNKGGIIKRVKY